MTALLRLAVDLDVTFFDTAQVYGPFTNESWSGKPGLLSATRWSSPPSSGSPPTRPASKVVRSRPADIKESAEGSLKCLGVGTIGLFYQHRVDPEVPIDDVAGALKELIEEGKVRHFGLSEPGVQTIRRARVVQHVAAPAGSGLRFETAPARKGLTAEGRYGAVTQRG